MQLHTLIIHQHPDISHFDWKKPLTKSTEIYNQNYSYLRDVVLKSSYTVNNTAFSPMFFSQVLNLSSYGSFYTERQTTVCFSMHLHATLF